MFRTPTRRAARHTAALTVAAGLLAAGCGQVQPGSAALIGEQRIATDELSQSVSAVESAAEQQQLRISDRSSLVRGVLSREISAVLLEEAAQRKGITVTRGDVDQRIAQVGGRKQLQQRALQRFAVPPSGLREHIRHQLIQQRLASKLSGGSDPSGDALVTYLQRVAKDMDVTVSPRYGSFNTQQLSVVQDKSDLSTPESSQATPGLAGGSGSGG